MHLLPLRALRFSSFIGKRQGEDLQEDSIMSEHVPDASQRSHARPRLPRVGESAPDFSLPAIDGGTVRLAEYPKPIALVFLRHLM